MRVWVRKEDIMKGLKGHCLLCPIALALSRKFCYVSVDRYRAYFEANKSYDLSITARQFVNDFDYGRKVKPGYMTMRKRKHYPTHDL